MPATGDFAPASGAGLRDVELSVTGEALIAKDPAQAGSTQFEAPKSANQVSTNFSATETAGFGGAHPKPEKRKNARERALDKLKAKSGNRNDADDDSKDGTKPMTAAAKSDGSDKMAKAKEKAKAKADDKARKAETKAHKISAAKAAKAARG
jgi:hypothetical protein